MKRLLQTIGLTSLYVLCIAQDIDSTSVISTRWSDSFVEWEIYSNLEEESPCGELVMRWSQNNDWSQWDYRIGEVSGEIRTEWNDRMDEWQLTSEGEMVTMKTRWPGDFSEWRISDSDDEFIFSVENVTRPEEWQVKYQKNRKFQVYTEFEQDLRSWLIFQEGGALRPATQMAMVFVTILSTVPKM